MKDPKYLGIPNINFSLTSEKDYRENEYRKQRIETGFDDSETWCLSSTIAKFVLPRLKRFLMLKKKHLIIDKVRIDEIKKMISALELIIRNDGEWTFSKKEETILDEGLKLFSENFMSLWW